MIQKPIFSQVWAQNTVIGIALAITSAFPAKSQTHRLSVSVCDDRVYNVYGQARGLLDVLGAEYQFELKKGVFFGAGYSYYSRQGSYSGMNVADLDFVRPQSHGKISGRHDYSFADAFIGYKLPLVRLIDCSKSGIIDRMELSARIGPSLAHGTDMYFYHEDTTVGPFSSTRWDVVRGEAVYRKASYWGATMAFHIDYRMLRNRNLTVGLAYMLRLFDGYPTTANYGFRVGYSLRFHKAR